MRTVLLSLFAVALCGAAEPVQLFNGKDMTGWKHVGPGQFTIENGMLKTEGGMGLLYYTGQKIGDQTVRIVFKTASERANSGVIIRLPDPPPDPWYGVHEGYEVQIDSAGDDWHCTGAIYSLSKATKRLQKPQGEWNTMDIEVKGNITRIMLNGEVVNEFDQTKPVPERKQWYEPIRGPRPSAGYIGLQNHDPRSTVYFKEISLIDGAATPLQTMPQGERERLLSYFQSTRKEVIDEVTGLSDAQWSYKESPERWSIAEILEHLVLSENNLFAMAVGGLKSKDTAPEKPMTNEALIAMEKDRSQKAKAPEGFRPTGKWTKNELLDEFLTRRDRNDRWIETTADNLTGTYVKSPLGTLSVYQLFLITPAHVERHLAQMREVKAAASYPKK